MPAWHGLLEENLEAGPIRKMSPSAAPVRCSARTTDTPKEL
ncbi:MAG: hypothetical protein AVDCRST_MAG71-1450 [uncultured Lysobacter sp.]|uniref:Uncharacterized protein n=1 Tax=uncultured Lysobacter sp. TaxID=271060 RepID=A0A6J4L7U0_9GAMM|nr:MAG: hypothetical protein AVDCRST_MAG71-1450 [uncultured Lysobacter sp.]